MNRWDYLFLGLLGLVVVMSVAAFQAGPGYMDADYYYAGGLQLAAGKGFTDPYLWNYLDDPRSLPQPSHAYWMPLASILAAIVPSLFENTPWYFLRIPFFLTAACIPPVTAALAYSLTIRRSLAFVSGFLAVFSGFYLPFLATTDTFAVYMLLAVGIFLVVNEQLRKRKNSVFHLLLLGILSGLMHLSRADGLLWLFVALVGGYFICSNFTTQRIYFNLLVCTVLVFTGYLLVMVPWFLRNCIAFNNLLAPGGSKMFWLTTYDQIFSYPATGLTFTTWIQSGLGNILRARLWSFGMNLASTFTVQGSIFHLPLILTGLWHLRKQKVVKLTTLAWLLTFAAMTLAFPFAGARGGFFHSGAAFQSMWWVFTPIGLERIIQWGIVKRSWRESSARTVFMIGLVGLTVFFSLLVLQMRLPDWNQEASTYRKITTMLQADGMSSEDVVIVSNPPGFYLASSQQTIAVPDGNVAVLQELAERFGADYLILEKGSIPVGLMPIYDAPYDFEGLHYIDEVEEARVYSIQP